MCKGYNNDLGHCRSGAMKKASQNPPQRCVHIRTTARLHMGFIDMHGGLGRRFGSIGLSLDKPETSLTAELGEDFSATGPGATRVVECARRIAQGMGIPTGAHFEVAEAIPEHAGLGSGTQLAIAIGVALARLNDLELSARDVAALSSRGARSGIGIGAFEQGGLLVDAGRGSETHVPPLVSRMDFPPQWRVLLVHDPECQGVHGKQELQAFGELPEFPASQAAHIARLVLMQALPAIAEHDLRNFGMAISELQRIVGDYFADAQGGGRYASPAVAEAIAWLESKGVNCVGQSSWGPTGFAIVGSEMQALQLLQDLKIRGTKLRYEICSGRNEGSVVKLLYATAPSAVHFVN